MNDETQRSEGTKTNASCVLIFVILVFRHSILMIAVNTLEGKAMVTFSF
jgi:hypothetical protein